MINQSKGGFRAELLKFKLHVASWFSTMAAVAAVKFRRLEEDEEEDTEKGDIGNGLAEATKEKVLSESCTIVVEEDAEATLEKERHLLARVKRSIKDKKNSRVCSVINSWKAVVAGLIAFTLAMGISLLIYKLVKEPSPPFHPGKYKYKCTYSSCEIPKEFQAVYV